MSKMIEQNNNICQNAISILAVKYAVSEDIQYNLCSTELLAPIDGNGQ